MNAYEILQKMWDCSHTIRYCDWHGLRAFRYQKGLLDESDFPAVIEDMKLRGFTHFNIEEMRECLEDDPFSDKSKLISLDSPEALFHVERMYRHKYRYVL